MKRINKSWFNDMERDKLRALHRTAFHSPYLFKVLCFREERIMEGKKSK